MAAYHEAFDDLRDIYLEDSWVLQVQADGHTLRFVLDAVPTEAHPYYHGPRPDEQYDYRRAGLTIMGRNWCSGPPALDRQSTRTASPTTGTSTVGLSLTTGRACPASGGRRVYATHE